MVSTNSGCHYRYLIAEFMRDTMAFTAMMEALKVL